MKPHLLASTLLFCATSVMAADYFVVVPVKGRTAAAPAQDIQVSLNAYTLPEAISGLAYTFDLKPLLTVTGDNAYTGTGVTWSVVSSTLPAGLYLTSDGYIGGTPTAAGTGSIKVRANYRTKNGEQTYQVVAVALTVSLSAASPPIAVVGKYYGYDLKSMLTVSGDDAYSSDKVSWGLVSGSLPSGLSLSSSGIIAGTATAAATSTATVRATYRGISGARDYVVQSAATGATLNADSGYSTNFGNVFNGKTATQRMLLRNTGSLPITGLTAQVSGSTYLSVASTTCGATLAPSSTCTYDLAYNAPSENTLAASLNVSSPELVTAASVNLTGAASNVLYAKGTSSNPVFIGTGTGTSGTYLGDQVSTTQVPQITAAYLGGKSIGYATPKQAEQITLISSSGTSATYLMGVWDTAGPAPWYTKMLQVQVTLSGSKAYATVTAARYSTTTLTTGAASNILSLWNGGVPQDRSTSNSVDGYGVAGLTVVGF